VTGEAVRLYVGMDKGVIHGERLVLTGPRMFNGQYGPCSKFRPEEVPLVEGWCDSGAFNDPPDKRLSPDAALDRQLAWEERAANKWNAPYRHNAVVSYDLLIDEKWVNGKKRKERWGVAEADRAVRVTVDAAAYLTSQRERLGERKLVMATQGVDDAQYAECAAGVLAHCRPGDVFGLGGWCILGLYRSWLPTFWASMRRTLPLVAAAGLDRVHVFGVMWQVPLGGLVWLADRLGLAVSTDSKKSVSDCCWKTPEQRRQAGARREHWRDNVAWWRDAFANLRLSEFYREPPAAPEKTAAVRVYTGGTRQMQLPFPGGW
jgi:hypothetical protein